MKVVKIKKRDKSRYKSSKPLGDIGLSKLTLHKLDWLEWLTIGLSIWFVLYPYPSYKLLLIILLIIPIFGILLNGLDKPSLASLVDIKLDNKKRTVYDVADFINVAAWAILIRLLWDYKFDDFYSWIIPGIAGSFFTLAVLFSTHKLITENYQDKIWIYASVILNIILYSFAGVYAINCAFDNSKPENYTTTVLVKTIDKYRYRGRDRTNYEVTITPWGRYKEHQIVATNASYYNSIKEGDRISITLKNGLLGIPFIDRKENPLYK